MKNQLYLTAAALLLAGQACFAQYNQAATNVYAPGAGTNFVDTSATAIPNDLLTFSNAVFEAYALDLGGDMHFPATTTTGKTYFRATYGVNQGKWFTIVSDTPMQVFAPPAGSFWTVSGSPNGYGICNNSDQTYYNLAIGQITNVGTGLEMSTEKVVKLGFVVCSKTDAKYPIDVKATVTFSDYTTTSATATIAAPRTYGDTFYGFSAPAGQSIINVLLEAFDDGTTTPVSTRIGLDDIGFVTESTLPRPPTIGEIYPANGAVHWASNGFHFQATSASPIQPNAFTVLLNSNNISSQLSVGGDSTNRIVSFNGLSPNLKYKLEVWATNSLGGSVGEISYFYTPDSSPVTVFDVGGFASDVLYPVGWLTTITNNDDTFWITAVEPAEVVDLADGTHGKVLRRMQTGTDYGEYAMFTPVASGVVTVLWDAHVSDIDGRTLDFGLQGYDGARTTQGPFLMWGTNALSYYNGSNWVSLASLDAAWHHFEMTAYVSGAKAGTFDLKQDNTSLGTGLVWRSVFSPVGSLRVGAYRGAVAQYGEIDNVVVKVAPEPLAPLPVTVLNPVYQGSNFSLSFRSLAGLKYVVEYCSNLGASPAAWTALETIPGDGTEKTVTHTNAPAGQLFYRVKSELP